MHNALAMMLVPIHSLILICISILVMTQGHEGGNKQWHLLHVGTLPTAWSTPGAFPNLYSFDIFNNNDITGMF